MSRSRVHLENNSFVKGLITEASPLTFPENASIDENNVVLNTDGTRDRRLGIDYESSNIILTSDQQIPAAKDTIFSTFNWENVSGDAEIEIIVVQIGNKLSFFDALKSSVSNNKIGSDITLGDGSFPYGFASVDGLLIIATNSRTIEILEFDGTNITTTNDTLKIRDLFGLEDILAIDGVNQDLNSPAFVTHRPKTEVGDPNSPVPAPNSITDPHLYNLRNQSWGV
ncbi:MAG: hypothetical protein JKY53_14765, partial [Flavobacteriales bacterium]|nr:hypothetical protein [Flavobacteriales bacterium]